MGGWVDGRVDGWMDGKAQGENCTGWVDGRLNGWMDGWFSLALKLCHCMDVSKVCC